MLECWYPRPLLLSNPGAIVHRRTAVRKYPQTGPVHKKSVNRHKRASSPSQVPSTQQHTHSLPPHPADPLSSTAQQTANTTLPTRRKKQQREQPDTFQDPAFDAPADARTLLGTDHQLLSALLGRSEKSDALVGVGRLRGGGRGGS